MKHIYCNDLFILKLLNNLKGYLFKYNSAYLLLFYFLLAKNNRLNYYIFSCYRARLNDITVKVLRTWLDKYWKFSYFFFAQRNSVLFLILEFHQEKVNWINFSVDYFFDDSLSVTTFMPYDKFYLRLDLVYYFMMWYGAEGIRMSKFNQYISGHPFLGDKPHIRRQLIQTLFLNKFPYRKSTKRHVLDFYLMKISERKFVFYKIKEFESNCFEEGQTDFIWNNVKRDYYLNYSTLSLFFYDKWTPSSLGRFFLFMGEVMWNAYALIVMAKFSKIFYSTKNVYFYLQDLFTAVCVHPLEFSHFVNGYSLLVESYFHKHIVSKIDYSRYYFLNDLLNYNISIDKNKLIKDHYCHYYDLIPYIVTDYFSDFFYYWNSTQSRVHWKGYFYILYTICEEMVLFPFFKQYETGGTLIDDELPLRRLGLFLDYFYWRLYNPEHNADFVDQRLYNAKHFLYVKLEADRILFYRYVTVFFYVNRFITNLDYFMKSRSYLRDYLDPDRNVNVEYPYMRISSIMQFFMLRNWYLVLFRLSLKFGFIFFFMNWKTFLTSKYYEDLNKYQANLFLCGMYHLTIYKVHTNFYTQLFREYRFSINKSRWLKSDRKKLLERKK